jgi:hypothetical protein
MNKITKIVVSVLVIFSLSLTSCNGSNSSTTSYSSVSSTYTQEELDAIVDEIIDTISDYITEDVVEDVTLIKSLNEYPGFSVNWISNNQSVISNEGKLSRPNTDTFVRLNYVIDYLDQVVKVGYFNVKVIGKEADAYNVILEWLYDYDFAIPTPLYFAYQVKTDVPGYQAYKIKWTTNNSPYLKVDDDYLLPRSVNSEQLVTLRAQIDINGKLVSREFKVTIPSENDPLLTKNGVPVININTYGQPITSHETYVSGTFAMTRSQAYKESYEVSTKDMGIRLRGNSTSMPNKKPYRIKFNSKQSLFGMAACKSWVLLAEHYDETYLRNSTAFYLGSQLSGLKFTPRFYHVEVYLNNKYIGLYVLTDQVQVDKSRVDIVESTDADTGYLMYWDSRAAEEPGAKKDVTYIDSIGPTLIEFKSPEQLTTAQRAFIGNYLTAAYEVVRTSSNNYGDYIDVDSAIDYIIVNEIFKTQDIGAYSVYMYKPQGGKLFFGPLWDFDLSSGNVNYSDRGLPNYWFTMMANRNQWLRGLMKNQDFRVKFQNRWNEIREDILPSVFTYINERRQIIYKAALANDALYPERYSDTSMFGNPPQIRSLTSFNAHTDYFYNWLNASMKFLDDEIRSEAFTQTSYASRFNESFNGKPELPLESLPKFI